MKVTLIGPHPEVELSIGGESVRIQNGVPVEIRDDWRERALSNQSIIEVKEEKPAKKSKD